MRSISLFVVITSIILIQYITRAQNTEVTINLRIEGDQNTIFESNILTKGKTVTTNSGGIHRCDGTNNNDNSIPGPTIISTLDLAATKNNFTWDGTFSELYDDYSITRIGNTSQTKSQYWNILIDYKFVEVGGCQQKVKQGDNVLFAFDAFNKKHILKLETSNYMSKIGFPFTVKVTDGLTNQPIEDAIVANQLTNINGFATIVFKNLGIQKLKAEREDSIRSNAIVIDITA